MRRLYIWAGHVFWFIGAVAGVVFAALELGTNAGWNWCYRKANDLETARTPRPPDVQPART